jgi:hypothetical protein
MPRALQVSVIQRNILDQLQAAREVFEQMRALGDIAEKLKDNQQLTKEIAEVMQKLLEIGERLSKNARDTSDKVLDFVGVE